LAFSAAREGPLDLYQKATNGVGDAELLMKSNTDKFAFDWSADGRFLSVGVSNAKNKLEQWILPLDGGRKPFPLLQKEFNVAWGMFSPDGRWLAYTSDETGRSEIYVQTFNPVPESEGQSAGAK
jgi:Tol biopolymer transport system component